MACRVDNLGKNSFHHVRRFRIPTRITIIDYLFCIDFSSRSFYLVSLAFAWIARGNKM